MITKKLRTTISVCSVVLFVLISNNTQASIGLTEKKENNKTHNIFFFAFDINKGLIQEAKRKHSRNKAKRKGKYKREKRWKHRDYRDWGFKMRRHDEWHKPWKTSGFCQRNPSSYSCQRYGDPYSGWSFEFFPH